MAYSPPENFNSHGFTRVWSIHFDTELQFRKNFDEVFQTVETALESIMNNLVDPVHDLITTFISLKVNITLGVTLENMDTGEISPKPINAQYVKVLNSSRPTIESVIMTQTHYIAASLNTYSMDGNFEPFKCVFIVFNK